MVYQTKGQSAIEYLTTYGWMLLVIAIVGGAVFTTVQNSSQIQSTSGLANADVQVDNFGVTGSGFEAELRGASSDQVENVNFSLKDPETGKTVYATELVTIPVADTATVSLKNISSSETTNTYDVEIEYDTGGLSDLRLNGSITDNFEITNNSSKNIQSPTGGFSAIYNTSQIAFGGYDDTVLVHDTDSWSQEARFSSTLHRITDIDWSPNSTMMMYSAGYDDNAVYVHNTSDWSQIARFGQAPTSPHHVDWSPNAEKVAFTGADTSEVFVYNTSNWALAQTLTEAASNSANMYSVKWSPDGSQLAYGTNYEDGKVYIHNTSDWQLAQTLTQSSGKTVRGVSWSPDGSKIAYSSQNERVYIHNTENWGLEASVSNSSEAIETVDWSHDNAHLAYSTASISGNPSDVYVYNTDDWSLNTTLSEASEGVQSVEWSPENDEIAYTDGDGEVHIHTVGNWNLEQTISYGTSTIYDVAWNTE